MSRLVSFCILIGVGAVALLSWRCQGKTPVKKTIADRLAEFGPVVRHRLAGNFAKAGIAYPPHELVFVAIKKEKRFELFAASKHSPFLFIQEYPILGASGKLGPKLMQGDSQVPEGIYAVESLNPNSLYHLSIRLNYPNQFDRARAREDGRSDLGGDIMIHGSNVSIGCLAMGNEGAEDLFVLAALAGIKNVRVIIAPVDFRVSDEGAPSEPVWTAELYREVKKAMMRFPSSRAQSRDPDGTL